MRTPCEVEVQGLQARPALNGQRGRAEYLDATSGRYHVTMHSGETVALRPANLRELPQDQPRAAAAPGGGGGWLAMPTFLANVEAKHIGIGVLIALVFGAGVSLMNAGLIVALGLLCHRQAQRHGGIGPAGRVITRTVAESVRRITGQQVTPAQATLLLIACTMVLLWWSGIYDSFVSSWRGGRRSSSWFGPPSSPSSRRRMDGGPGGGYYDGDGGSGFFGLGSGVDLSFMLGAMMLGSMVWRLGGGSRPEGWSLGQFFHSVQNMDMWQMMMFINLVQQVLGGGRRRGGMGYGGFGRRGMYF